MRMRLLRIESELSEMCEKDQWYQWESDITLFLIHLTFTQLTLISHSSHSHFSLISLLFTLILLSFALILLSFSLILLWFLTYLTLIITRLTLILTLTTHFYSLRLWGNQIWVCKICCDIKATDCASCQLHFFFMICVNLSVVETRTSDMKAERTSKTNPENFFMHTCGVIVIIDIFL